MTKHRVFIFLAAFVLGGITAAGVAFFSIRASRELYDYLDRKNRESSVLIAAALNKRLQAIEDAAEANGRALETMPALTRKAVEELLEQSFRSAAGKGLGIYAMAVAVEPGVLQDDPAPVMLYVRPGGIAVYDAAKYRYPCFPWYCVPRHLGATIWSEPYFDDGAGEALMTTSSMPFYRVADGKKQFAGVATADVTLTQLQRFLNSQQDHPFKFMFMVSRFGRLLSNPDISKAMTETIYSVAENNNAEISEQFRSDIRAERPGMARISRPILGIRKGNLYYAPLAANEWSLVAGYDLKAHQQYSRNITFLGIFIGMGLFGVLMTGVIIVSRKLACGNKTIKEE